MFYTVNIYNIVSNKMTNFFIDSLTPLFIYPGID